LPAMAPISISSATHPKEIIEQTFSVFCGTHETMDEAGFAKFCESIKSVPASDARAIFCTVVPSVHSGMDLREFKAALGLLVNDTKTSHSRPDRELLTDRSFKSSKVIRIATPQGLTRRRRPSYESHLQNAVGIKSAIVETNSDVSTDIGSDDDLHECPNSDDGQHGFRWSPMAISESINGSEEPVSPSHKRTIRWCPADFEE